MEYTAPDTAAATAALGYADLAAAFANVPDPRRRASTKYTVSNLLLAATAAFLANHRSLSAVAEWVADQEVASKQALGFVDDETPCQSTLFRFFRKLDPAALTTALRAYFDPPQSGAPRPRASQAISVAGKSLRGTLSADVSGIPTHILNAFCHELALVLTQLTIERKHNEASSVPALIADLDWQGRIFVADALFCYPTLCAQVVAAGGDYLIVVKANQPALYADIQTVFDTTQVSATVIQTQSTTQTTKGHGRVEVRQCQVTSELVGYSRWPHLAQVCAVTRTWISKGATHCATRYIVTSIPADIADAATLLRRHRGHWGVENKVHYVCDVVFGEDASQVKTGHGAQTLARIRATALNLLRQAGFDHITQRLRHNSRHSSDVLALLGRALPRA